MRRGQPFSVWTNRTNRLRRMKTANCSWLSAAKLRQETCERRRSSHVEHMSSAQVFVRRNRTAIGIRREQHRSLLADHVLYQRQDSIEREAEVQTVNRAVQIDHVARTKPKLIDKDRC